MKRACVIGDPVAHSLSPAIHGYWLKHYRIDGEYKRQAVEAAHLAQFVHSLPSLGFAGCNVTLPHKIAAHQLCNVRDAAADAIGAVNTLWFETGVLHGSNTDAFGFIANLDEAAPGWDGAGKCAVVIGAGGAARAIVFALRQRGFEDIRIVNRSIERARELASAFHPAKAFGFEAMTRALEGAALIVNTSSLGMTGLPPLSIDLSHVEQGAAVCDIVYSPLETELLLQARTRGLKAVDGLGMLLYQAVPGFEKWFGVRPEVTSQLRENVLLAVKARESGAK